MQRTSRFIATTLVISMSLFLILSLTNIKTAFTRETQVQISNIRISNLTHNSVSISWLTDTATDGSVRYGTDPNDLSLGTEADDRDREEVSPGFTGTTHHVTIHGLDPDTTYSFSVTSDGGNSVNTDDTNVFTTFSDALDPTRLDTSVSGVTTDENGTFLPNSIIYLRITDGDGNGSTGNSTLLSYLSRDGDGVWFNFDPFGDVTISMARTEEGGPFEYSRTGSDILEIEGYLDPNCSEEMSPTLENVGNVDDGEENRIQLTLSCDQGDTPTPTTAVTVTSTEPAATATATSTEIPPDTSTPTSTPTTAVTVTSTEPAATATATATSTEIPPDTSTPTSTPTTAVTATSTEPAATATPTSTPTPLPTTILIGTIKSERSTYGVETQAGFLVMIENSGNVSADNLSIQITFSSDLTFVEGAPGNDIWSRISDDVYEHSLDSLAPASETALSIELLIGANLAVGHEIETPALSITASNAERVEVRAGSGNNIIITEPGDPNQDPNALPIFDEPTQLGSRIYLPLISQ